MLRFAALAWFASLIACGGGGFDVANPANDATTDATTDAAVEASTDGPVADTAVAETLLPPVDSSTETCAIGTVEACTSCTDKCDGTDDFTGKRVCSGKCSYECNDGRYDVDQKVGATPACEFEELDTNFSEKTALQPWGPKVSFCDLGSCPGGGYVWKSYSGVYPSDLRVHRPSGLFGEKGRPRFFTSTAATEVCGTLCEDNPAIRLRMSGGSGSYELILYKAGSGPATPLCKVVWNFAAPPIGAYAEDTSCGSLGEGTKWYLLLRKIGGPPEKPSFEIGFRN